MQCPKCNTKSQVIRTECESDGSRKRTRKCEASECSFRFVTIERIRGEHEAQPVSEALLTRMINIDQAVKKRPQATFDAEAITAAIVTDRRRAAIKLQQSREEQYETDDDSDEKTPNKRMTRSRALNRYS